MPNRLSRKPKSLGRYTISKLVQKNVLAVGLDVATGGWHRFPQGEVGYPVAVSCGNL